MYILFQELCLQRYFPPLLNPILLYEHNIIRNSQFSYDHEYPGFFHFIELVDEKLKTSVLSNTNGTYI